MTIGENENTNMNNSKISDSSNNHKIDNSTGIEISSIISRVTAPTTMAMPTPRTNEASATGITTATDLPTSSETPTGLAMIVMVPSVLNCRRNM